MLIRQHAEGENGTERAAELSPFAIMSVKQKYEAGAFERASNVERFHYKH